MKRVRKDGRARHGTLTLELLLVLPVATAQLVARSFHQNSPRADRAFITVNSASMFVISARNFVNLIGYRPTRSAIEPRSSAPMSGWRAI